MKFSQIALLSAATVVAAEHHNHLHRHPARQGSPVEERDAAVVTVPGPVVTVTVYELNGQDIPYDQVEQGLEDGKYVLIGETISTVITPTTSAAPSTSSTSSSTTTTSTPAPAPTVVAAEFFEKVPSTSEAPAPAPTTSAAPAPAPPPASSPPSGGSSGGNLNADFPSGQIDCSEFPSAYGAVPLDWLGLDGWSGVQLTPNYNGDLTSKNSIPYASNAIANSGGCVANSFCSYACPAGYQKIQWPQGQGSTGQSIGGLYCNSNGKLELSRLGVSQLCGEGAGGVQVKNNLSQNVAICRTDYPGTEGETIPLDATPGGTFPLTNVISAEYYTWEGSATTAQYYINPQGASVAEACQWGSAGSNMGNWAPVNCGVGQGAGGVTFISLFPNVPTNPTGKLDYSIKITGNVIGDCEYKNGAYYSNNVIAPHGCTVSVSSGGTATFEFS